jgi:hypothetical protein
MPVSARPKRFARFDSTQSADSTKGSGSLFGVQGGGKALHVGTIKVLELP